MLHDSPGTLCVGRFGIELLLHVGARQFSEGAGVQADVIHGLVNAARARGYLLSQLPQL